MNLPSWEYTVGGIGLLLLGMGMLTDGLKLAAGGTLHERLKRSTRTRLRGLLAGFTLTAVVQSSSAVTMATLGFANAGLLSLEQAAWLVFGSNVGTTVTGWLVSLIGMDFKIEAFALPMVGLGILVRVFRPRDRVGALAGALAGFGLLFLGLSFLKSSFADLGDDISRLVIANVGLAGVFYGFLIGALMTAVMQSSSAAIAIVITAYAQGVVGDVIGASLIIGANVGTTSTAILASIGATPNGKRLALLHVMFNVTTAVVAIVLLVPLLWIIAAARDALGASGSSAVTLAVFHTVFNVVGVLLMWPLARRLTVWLDKRFVVPEADAARPMYLDNATLSVPGTGIVAASLELRRIGEQINSLVGGLLRHGSTQKALRSIDECEALLDHINEFISKLTREAMAAESAARLMDMLNAVVRFRAGLLATRNWIALTEAGSSLDELPQPMTETLRALAGSIDHTQPQYAPASTPRLRTELREQWRAQRASLLEEAAQGRVPSREATRQLQLMSVLVQFANHVSKAASALGTEASERAATPADREAVSAA